jgi:hypothetical protein
VRICCRVDCRSLQHLLATIELRTPLAEDYQMARALLLAGE